MNTEKCENSNEANVLKRTIRKGKKQALVKKITKSKSDETGTSRVSCLSDDQQEEFKLILSKALSSSESGDGSCFCLDDVLALIKKLKLPLDIIMFAIKTVKTLISDSDGLLYD